MDTNETVLFFSIIGVAVLLLIFLAIFYKGSRRVQEIFFKAHTGRMEAEVVGMERERKRVAEDLHDETGAIIYDVMRKAYMIEPKDSASRQLLDDLQLGIRKIDESVHDIGDGLVPMNLKHGSVHDALHDLIVQRQDADHISIRLYGHHVSGMEEMRLLHLYRIIQESMNNAIKHSGATVLEISVSEQYGYVVIGVRDNGKGFKQEDNPALKKGMGLKNIYNRMRILGGEIYLNSEKGCEWIFSIPIAELT